MASRTVVTDIGREWWARFHANYPTWSILGTPYRLFYAAKWGEGGWETVGGIDVPKDPALFVANTDIEIIEDAASYPGYSYSSGLIPIDLPTEVTYVGGATQITQVTAHLDTGEENDNGAAGNPRFFEVGIFDNALAAGLDTEDHLILYTTFDGFLKTITRTVDEDMNIPFKP